MCYLSGATAVKTMVSEINSNLSNLIIDKVVTKQLYIEPNGFTDITYTFPSITGYGILCAMPTVWAGGLSLDVYAINEINIILRVNSTLGYVVDNTNLVLHLIYIKSSFFDRIY